MRTMGTQALLDAWEAGHTQAPQRWALTVLALAEPEHGFDALAHFSIGQRDAGLLTWRCSVFGRQLGVIEQCPRCGEQLEVDLDANANAVAIAHLKLENEGWKRDESVTEPTEPQFTDPA